jgi:hypothetical protein
LFVKLFYFAHFILYHYYLLNLKEEASPPFAGVVDGGDIASVKYTASKLNCNIKDNTCICHLINNIIKRMLNDYFEEHYLVEWRKFIKRIRKSHPFSETWDTCCELCLEGKVTLQKDTPTRWSSTLSMMDKAVKVNKAVERMSHINTLSAEEKVLRFCFKILLFINFFSIF